MNQVKIVLRDQNCLPQKAHQSDAGYDLRSLHEYVINPNEQTLVDTGINIGLPHDDGYIYEAQIRPRSGLALKKGITITNSPGTIDEQYHGNIGVIVRNTGKQPFVINKYDKIAQMVITRIPKVELVVVDSLQDTERGSNGFGSTGI